MATEPKTSRQIIFTFDQRPDEGGSFIPPPVIEDGRKINLPGVYFKKDARRTLLELPSTPAPLPP
jgi:hypothetical protein